MRGEFYKLEEGFGEVVQLRVPVDLIVVVTENLN